ncbi:PLD nuclease N-terminal domain-containing protein [Actinotalea sp. M2MS4P-6]|uniref:PLD nuclease N-terminal domain-containing protein n=1 Tax=Actinotalea sp. M2MS4P-6 TaxID=2983762 RepID=UPI0021E496D5|nr:PLD nuclease N-terminal domain-containing protein [Actinotalea sp. M2MS4P-6]MCV2393822.1 PLD nuclease N-terminal domain-containing protein [Actinotalea sp. M2MS4P-6]
MLRNVMVLVGLGLAIYALADCVQARRYVRTLPWGMWVLVILVPFVGPIAYLMAGRPTAEQARRSVPWAATTTAGFPEHERPRDVPPRGPEDDPEFLAKIAEERRHEQMLKDWEAQLREREESLDRDDSAREADTEDDRHLED